jgi:hypothetical protein
MDEPFGDPWGGPDSEGNEPRTEAERLDPSLHVNQSDPWYDGFRIRELWIVTAVGPDDQEGVLHVPAHYAIEFHLEPGPAFAADERRLRHLRDFARMAARETGLTIRIRHFVREGEPEEFGG